MTRDLLATEPVSRAYISSAHLNQTPGWLLTCVVAVVVLAAAAGAICVTGKHKRDKKKRVEGTWMAGGCGQPVDTTQASVSASGSPGTSNAYHMQSSFTRELKEEGDTSALGSSPVPAIYNENWGRPSMVGSIVTSMRDAQQKGSDNPVHMMGPISEYGGLHPATKAVGSLEADFDPNKWRPHHFSASSHIGVARSLSVLSHAPPPSLHFCFRF
jgi:hypothetical protein